MPPVTLRQLLDQAVKTSISTKSQAPLKGKLLAACSLALFFEALYGVGCLHETFNSNNVIFPCLSTTLLASPNAWRELYIIGFQKCRPDGDEWATEGPPDDRSFQDYEHPEYKHNGRFQLEYDYYSLGLVLLEIGLWCPLQHWSKRREYRELTPDAFRSVLLEKYVPRLVATVGERYRDVVKVLLDDTLMVCRKKLGLTKASAEVFEIFLENVVKPLEELAVLNL